VTLFLSSLSLNGMTLKEVSRMFGNAYFRRMMTSVICTISMISPGCGEKGPDLAKVYGKVTMDGNPLPNVTVLFNPTQGGRPSLGTTGTDGSFVLYHTSGRKGVELGEHEVFIDPKEEEAAGSRPGPPKTYAVPKDKRNVSIAEGSHEMNFDLVSKSEKKK
jgi:hypothetical protein